MTKKTLKNETTKLLKEVINAMQDKKAKDIVSINLSKVENSIANYFVICSASSSTQINSIHENIIFKVHENLNLKPFHKEGYENSEWILIDYFDIVIHIFIGDTRKFYKLEDLWADGDFKRYQDVE
jgi:ribosome-associated protein